MDEGIWRRGYGGEDNIIMGRIYVWGEGKWEGGCRERNFKPQLSNLSDVL